MWERPAGDATVPALAGREPVSAGWGGQSVSQSVMSVRRGSTFKEYQFPGTSAADKQDPPWVRDLEFIGHGGRGGAGRVEESRVWGVRERGCESQG